MQILSDNRAIIRPIVSLLPTADTEDPKFWFGMNSSAILRMQIRSRMNSPSVRKVLNIWCQLQFGFVVGITEVDHAGANGQFGGYLRLEGRYLNCLCFDGSTFECHIRHWWRYLMLSCSISRLLTQMWFSTLSVSRSEDFFWHISNRQTRSSFWDDARNVETEFAS